MRKAAVDDREVAVEERRVTVEERQLDAAIRDELRSANTVLMAQMTVLTKDNTATHKRIHDLANSFANLQLQIMDLTDDRDQCRRDLAEVLTRVVQLEEGDT